MLRTPLSPMFSMKDGSLSRPSTNGASASSKRRRVSRAVSSSGGIAKTRLLEGRQSIAEFHPADIVAQPRMMRRRKRPGRIETAGGDVDEVGRIEMLVRQRRPAGPAKAAPHL